MSVFEKFGVLDPAVLEQQVLQFSSEKVRLSELVCREKINKPHCAVITINLPI
jgi:hypothetical protein